MKRNCIIYPVIFIGVFLLTSGSARAQPDSLSEKKHELLIISAAGWNYNIILDKAVSPILYRGHGYGLQAGLEKGTENRIDRLDLVFQHAGIQPDLENESGAALFRGQINWVRSYRLNPGNPQFKLYAGGHLLSTFNGTDHQHWANNGFSYSFAMCVGPSVLIKYHPFQNRENLSMAWEFSLPVMEYVMRPGLSSVLPEGTIRQGKHNTAGLILGGRITSIHEYQRFLSRIYLDWKMTEQILFRIEYQWDYQQYNVNNTYKSANHLVCAGAIWRLKSL